MPGRGFSFAGMRYRLWLGSDHLLCVSGPGYSEEYRRFYYRDIQAIITRRTASGEVLSVVFASLAAIVAAVFIPIGMRESEPAFVVGGLLFGLFFVGLLVNLALGPTCTCHLQTAVHRETLRSLHRMRTARKAINLMRSLIERAQGEALTAEEMERKTAELAQAAGSEPGYARAVARESQLKVHYGGKAHQILFTLLLLDVGLTCTDILYNHLAISVCGGALFLGMFACVVAALIKQRSSDITGGLRKVVWATLAYLCISTYVSSIYAQAVSVAAAIAENADAPPSQWEMYSVLANMSPWEHPVLLVILIVTGLCSLLLGIFGFALLRDFRRIHRVSPHEEALAGEEK